MDVLKDYFYFFSTEMYSPELPIKCKSVKQLATKDEREAIFVMCDEVISAYDTKSLVLIPKYVGTTLLSLEVDEPVFAYVLNGQDYIDKSGINLALSSRLVLDWGGITLSRDTAMMWQVKEHETGNW